MLIVVSLSGIVAVPTVLLTLGLLQGSFRDFWPGYSPTLYLFDWLFHTMMVVLTLLFGLLAAAPAIRYLSRMDVAKVVSGERFG